MVAASNRMQLELRNYERYQLATICTTAAYLKFYLNLFWIYFENFTHFTVILHLYQFPLIPFLRGSRAQITVLVHWPCSPGSHQQESVLFTANEIKLTEINVPKLSRIWKRSGEADLANGPCESTMIGNPCSLLPVLSGDWCSQSIQIEYALFITLALVI